MTDNTYDYDSFIKQHSLENDIAKELVSVVGDIISACQKINNKVRLGSLANIIGEAGTGNVQGEEQKKLDVISNQILIETLSNNSYIAGLASEEEETFILNNQNGSYLVLFDPLDGSSNIDVNISIGTIFSVLRKTAGDLTEEHFLQAGKQQLVAGYVLYGPQTQLVITYGYGAFAFTLDNHEQFQLCKDSIVVPDSTEEFAINMSNQRHWEVSVQEYIAELLQGVEGIRGKNYNMRWVASMVAEVHRILMRGGIFLYPKDRRDPSKPGKLRLMYEANPMSLLIREAQGFSSNGYVSILDIEPESLHQRVSVILGSKEEVLLLSQKHSQ